MYRPPSFFWQKTPALRLLVPLMAGIVLQVYLPITFRLILAVFAILLIPLLLWPVLPTARRFLWHTMQGIFLQGIVAAAGMLLVYEHDIRNSPVWFEKLHGPQNCFLVQLEEPLVEKPNSFRSKASVLSVVLQQASKKCSGSVIIYFKKEPGVQQLGYGSQLLLHKELSEIKNSGNPGSFDYKRYLLFQGTTHQAYLSAKDYCILPVHSGSYLQHWLIRTRNSILSVLQKNIKGERERGLAEALLIGYKDHLDKTLVQSYSQTGVVHVIAISGLHLGLVYAIVLLLTRPLHRLQLLRALVVISTLWIFSLLAGAQPSVLRSAVMFTALAVAVVLKRKVSVYNSMAASAFLLLCYQPMWLWDIGFQLSYSAVLSILVFFKPVYHLFYLSNKAVDALWKMAAVTISAQVLTTPLLLFHFHQFPVIFLITNLVAVPLSSIILMGELVLCFLFFFPAAATLMGKLLGQLIRLMNDFIERMNRDAFVWEGISLTTLQTVLLYIVITGIAVWLMDKRKGAVWAVAFSMFWFMILRAQSFRAAAFQSKLIVYQVPKMTAIELLDGNGATFTGDPEAEQNTMLFRYHIWPARVQHRVLLVKETTAGCFLFHHQKILLLDQQYPLIPMQGPVAVVILSGNFRGNLVSLHQKLSFSQVVLDSSVPYAKAVRWKKQVAALGIPCHDVTQQGAFVKNF